METFVKKNICGFCKLVPPLPPASPSFPPAQRLASVPSHPAAVPGASAGCHDGRRNDFRLRWSDREWHQWVNVSLEWSDKAIHEDNQLSLINGHKIKSNQSIDQSISGDNQRKLNSKTSDLRTNVHGQPSHRATIMSSSSSCHHHHHVIIMPTT